MDGRGRCTDNIFIERLWRSMKYDALYLHEIADGFSARRLIRDWVRPYNLKRPHSSARLSERTRPPQVTALIWRYRGRSQLRSASTSSMTPAA